MLIIFKWGVITDFYNDKLVIAIIIVLLLLGVCVSVDYADNITITNVPNQTSIMDNKSIILPNDTSVIGVNKSTHTFVGKSSDKIYYKYPTISMLAKPSCGCRYSYTWHKYTFINYCPHCHRYGALLKNPKWVYEREYTCRYDDCDYCAVCGKEKYSWSNVYLRRA